MSRTSIRLRAQDLRSIYLLVGECCELGADPLIWRRHLLRRLNALFGAVASVEIEARLVLEHPHGALKPELALTLDSDAADARTVLTRCLAEMPFEANALGVAMAAAAPGRPVVARTRGELVDAGRWERCGFYTDYLAPLGWYESMMGIVQAPERMRFYNFVRARGDGDFPVRNARQLELAARELAALPPERLAPLGGASILQLPPRLRDVLVALAHGDNEKQIAARLGISRNTVHEYVRRLFDRYGVSSRSELLVRAARQIHALPSTCEGDDEAWLYRSGMAS